MGTIFSAYDIRGRVDETLTVEYVWTVGKAFAEWLPQDGNVVLVKGQSVNQATTHAFVEGVLLQGRNVIDCGTGGEQAVVGGIDDNQAAGGVLVNHDDLQNIEIITLFDENGSTVTAEVGLTAIGELVESGNFLPAAQKGILKT
jgi:phosphomannomutase